ncbi:MAG: NAD(P)/FAD-dependent oxidoreductase [Actinobacteria bacterium]|nr:NAD(P)/FAD-dependent oxidoreductase [Actinomycetota bacterium]
MAQQRMPTSDASAIGDYHDVVVVGAGIGGLACGALLAKEGLDVLLVERQARPGGYMNAVRRRGYSFQGPYLMSGCGPDGGIKRVVDHLGLKVEFRKVEPFHRYVYPDHDITVSGDIEAYKEVLKENFQPQTANINHFFNALEGISKGMDFRMLRRSSNTGSALQRLAYPVLFPRTSRHLIGGTTFGGLLDSCFTDEKLKAVLATPWPSLGSPPWELSALGMTGLLAGLFKGAYFPIGGFQSLSNAFAESFVENGGTMLLGREVTRIITEQGMVTGALVHPGERVTTSVVVSDADTKLTFLDLVEEGNFTRAFLDRVQGYRMSASGFVIHLGISKVVDDKDLSCGCIFVQPSYDHREMLDESRVTERHPDPAKLRWMVAIHSLQDPSLAPEGKTSLEILVPSVPRDFKRNWNLDEGGRLGERYRRTKEGYAEVVIEAVRSVFPSIVENVETYSISTPVTYERYSMASEGCWHDCAMVPEQAFNRRPGPATSVRGLFLTGSKSVLGGGIYGAVMGGVLAADGVLKGKLGGVLF